MTDDLKARLLAILNASLSPWTFDGAEPMVQQLVEAVEAHIASRSKQLAYKWRACADKGWDTATLSPDEIAMLREHADEVDPSR